MNHQTTRASGVHWGLKALAILTLVTLGLPLLIGGVYLMALGGSWYYALAGAAYTYAAIELLRGRMRGVWVLVAALVATALWALFESHGFNFWAFEARVLGSLFLGQSKVDPGRLTQFLNTHASQGWEVRTMEREIRRLFLFFEREALVFILDRDVR